MDLLTNLTPQAEQVEVTQLSSESTVVNFEANRLKGSEVKETSGIAVRIIKDGRLGFAASGDVTALDKLQRNVLESSAYGEQVPLVFPSPQPGPEVATFDETIAELPVARMADIGNEIIAYLCEIDPNIPVDVSLSRSIVKANIRNQAGVDIAFNRSPFNITVRLDRVKGDDILVMFDVQGTSLWNDDYMASVHQMSEKLRLAETVTDIKPGRMPVLFAPSAAVVLALPLMVGSDGKNVYKGISPIAGKVGEKLFDDSITLIDDPTIDGRFGSASYDDEGVPHRRNTLIDGGVLKGFLYDLKTAAQSGVESTGNGSRGLFNQPGPAPTNLLIAPGNTSQNDILAGIEEGLLVENVLGLGQGNILSGAFSNPVSLGFKIEKGEIVGRVKDVSIAGNIYELLSAQGAHNIVVSQETQWIYNTFNLPYILLDNMNVAGKN